MNNTIKLLMISDILVLTGYGFINPILAIFIKDDLAGGSIFAAGIAVSIYWILKSILQLPIAKYVDSHENKVKLLIIGSLIYPLVPIIYIFSTKVIHIYLAQAIFAIGASLAVPTWLGLFSTHLDKYHESFEWAIYSTSVGIGVGITGIIGAGLAQSIGFTLTFILVGVLSLIGWIILFFLERKNHKMKKVELTHYVNKKKALHGHHSHH